MPTPGPSQPQPQNDIKRVSIRTAQTKNEPRDNNTLGESTGTRNPPPTVGKGGQKTSHPKLLEVPTPVPHRKLGAVKPVTKRPSGDPENSAWNSSFDASTLDLTPAPTSSKNVNQPDTPALRQGTRSYCFSFLFFNKLIKCFFVDLFPKANKEKMDKSSSNSSDGSLLYFLNPGGIS